MAEEWPGTPVVKDTPATEESGGEWPGTPVSSDKQEKKNLSWADVRTSAYENLPESAKNFGMSLVQPFLQPIETAKNVAKIGLGELQTLGAPSRDEYGNPAGRDFTPYAHAVNQFFKDRYGGIENLKRTLAHDPVGFAADVSSVLTGGETALARLPGLTRAAETVGTVGRAVDPINLAVQGVSKGADYAGTALSYPLGHITGTGHEAIQQAAEAGSRGGQGAEEFQAHMRGRAPMSEVVTESRQAVRNLKQAKNANYQRGMSLIDDSRPIDFNELDNALQGAQLVKTFKGQNISPNKTAAMMKIMDKVNEWRNLDPTEYHTALGFDALKQSMGDIRDAQPYGTPERYAADKVYNAIRDLIIKNDPQYAQVMRGYENAKSVINEIEGTLVGKPGARIDPALRRLQSILRNNVNTNYGNRLSLAQYLESAGVPHLMKKLAGQALSAPQPRGLAGLATSLSAELGTILFGAQHGVKGALLAIPPIVGLAAASSPRLAGEGAYYAAKANRAIRESGASRAAGNVLYRSGQEQPPQQHTGGRVGYQEGGDVEGPFVDPEIERLRAEDKPLVQQDKPIASPGAGAAKGGAVKVTKVKSHYRAGHGNTRCKNCTMFRPPHGCTAVSGTISPLGLCDLFERKTERAVGGRMESAPLREGQEPDFDQQFPAGFYRGRPMEVPPPSGKAKDPIENRFQEHDKDVVAQRAAGGPVDTSHEDIEEPKSAKMKRDIEIGRMASDPNNPEPYNYNVSKPITPGQRSPFFDPERSDQQPNRYLAKGGRVPSKVEVIRKYDVPYLAGSSNDGKRVYIDRRVPQKLSIKLANGKGRRWIDPAIFLVAHEEAEHAAMMGGKPYEKAHAEDGETSEKAMVEKHGLDWKHYSEVFDGMIAHIEHEKPKRPPPDLFVKPYPHREQLLLKRLGSKKRAA